MSRRLFYLFKLCELRASDEMILDLPSIRVFGEANTRTLRIPVVDGRDDF